MVFSTRSLSDREAKGMSMAEIDRQTEARMAWVVLHREEVAEGMRGWWKDLSDRKGN
jgi:hypothetical protein